MQDFFTIRQVGSETVVAFGVSALMNPVDLDRVGPALLQLLKITRLDRVLEIRE